MSQIRRRRLFIDAKMQGALLTHVALYWLYCFLAIGVIALVWVAFVKCPSTSAELFNELWMNCGPAILGFTLLLPLVLLDCLRFSNRFAGPVYRLRRELKAMANGERPCPVHLREGDFWMDFAEDWNRILERENKSRQPAESSDTLSA